MINSEHERLRLEAVRRHNILDTPPDGTYDALAELAMRMLDCAAGVVSIVDSNRIWLKSHPGLDVDELERDDGLCASAVLQDGPWIVENAAVDPRTLTNPLVAGELGLRFYAGIPLRTAEGFNLGMLAVVDTKPRSLTDQELYNLTKE